MSAAGLGPSVDVGEPAVRAVTDIGDRLEAERVVRSVELVEEAGESRDPCERRRVEVAEEVAVAEPR